MLNYSNNGLRRVENELVFGGHIVSLISPALILTVCILQDISINIGTLLIAYIIPLIVYSYNYQNEPEKLSTNSEKEAFILNRKKNFPILMGLALLVLLFLVAESFNYGFFIFSLIILTGGILYTVILKVLTKYIFCFKNLYVAGIWAYAGTFFVLFYHSIDLTIFYYVIFVYIYVKIFINNVFFDIKDIESDKMKDLNTVPIKLGKDTTIYLLHILNIISVIILIIAIYLGILPLYAIFLLITNLYVLFYLEKGKTADYDGLLKYTYLMADAEFILWPIILIIGKIIFNYF